MLNLPDWLVFYTTKVYKCIQVVYKKEFFGEKAIWERSSAERRTARKISPPFFDAKRERNDGGGGGGGGGGLAPRELERERNETKRNETKRNETRRGGTRV